MNALRLMAKLYGHEFGLLILLFGANGQSSGAQLALDLAHVGEIYYQHFKVDKRILIPTVTVGDTNALCVAYDLSEREPRISVEESFTHLRQPGVRTLLAAWSAELQCFVLASGTCGVFKDCDDPQTSVADHSSYPTYVAGEYDPVAATVPYKYPTNSAGRYDPGMAANGTKAARLLGIAKSLIEQEYLLVDDTRLTTPLLVNSLRAQLKDWLFRSPSGEASMKQVLLDRLNNVEQNTVVAKFEGLSHMIQTTLQKMDGSLATQSPSADPCQIDALATQVLSLESLLVAWTSDATFYADVLERTLVLLSLALEGSSLCYLVVDANRGNAGSPASLVTLRDNVATVIGALGANRPCVASRLIHAMNALTNPSTWRLLTVDWCNWQFDVGVSTRFFYAPSANETNAINITIGSHQFQTRGRLHAAQQFTHVTARDPLDGFALNDQVVSIHFGGSGNDVVQQQSEELLYATVFPERNASMNITKASATVCGPEEVLGEGVNSCVPSAMGAQAIGCFATAISSSSTRTTCNFYSPANNSTAYPCNGLNGKPWSEAHLNRALGYYINADRVDQGTPQCPFRVTAATHYADPHNYGIFLPLPVGYYSGLCSNTKAKCVVNVPHDPLVKFTTPSYSGNESGCEVKLVFTATIKMPLVDIGPSFTLQLWFHAAQIATGRMILFGLFPRFYLALDSNSNTPSDGTLKVTLYHQNLTVGLSGRSGNDVITSAAFPWANEWVHIAVTCAITENSSERQISFYRNRHFISSHNIPSPQAVNIDGAIEPVFLNVWHLGPINTPLLESLWNASIVDWSALPYADAIGLVHSTDLTISVDEIRIHAKVLNRASLGYELTSRRIDEMCALQDVLGHNQCTPQLNVMSPTGAECGSNMEIVGAFPSLCVPTCTPPMLRHIDGSCACPLHYFPVWFTSAMRFTWQGSAVTLRVFNEHSQIIHSASHATPEIGFDPPENVTLIALQNGSTPTTLISLQIASSSGTPDWDPIAEYHDTTLAHVTYIYHRYAAPSTCVLCPYGANGNIASAPYDVRACGCASNNEVRNDTGHCVPSKGTCSPPTSEPSSTGGQLTYVQIGTPVKLHSPLCGTVHFTLNGDSPSCSSPQATDDGLILSAFDQAITVKAISCDSEYFHSSETEFRFKSVEVVLPPYCTLTGLKSTESAYALNVSVTLTANPPGARQDLDLFYSIGHGGYTRNYTMPFLLYSSATVYMWAVKLGLFSSSHHECEVFIDTAAIASVQIEWLEPQLGGYAETELGWVAQLPNPKTISFRFYPVMPVVQYRVKRYALATSDINDAPYGLEWSDAVGTTSTTITRDWIIQPNLTTVVRVEWRAKDDGHVFSFGQSQVILLNTTSQEPQVFFETQEAEFAHWNGPISQRHLTSFAAVESGAVIFFAFGTIATETLVRVNPNNATSLRTGALQNIFSWEEQNSVERDTLSTRCRRISTTTVRWCKYVLPFETYGGDVITVVSSSTGFLESAFSVKHCPLLFEPTNGTAFQCDVVADVPFTLVDNRDFVLLPVGTTRVTLSFTHDGFPRLWCEQRGNFGDDFDNVSCTWTVYQDPVSLEIEMERNTELRVKITIKVPQYLYSYPNTHRIVALNERSAMPTIRIVNNPLEVMISEPNFVTGDAFVSFYNEEQNLPGRTLNTQWYTFPQQISEDVQIRPSLQFTVMISDACIDGKVCEVPIKHGIPERLIAPLGDFVCAWVQTGKKRESLPTCTRVQTINQTITLNSTSFEQTCTEGTQVATAVFHTQKKWPMSVRAKRKDGINVDSWGEWKEAHWICDSAISNADMRCQSNVSVSFTFSTLAQEYDVYTRWQLTIDRYTQPHSIGSFKIEACKPPQTTTATTPSSTNNANTTNTKSSTATNSINTNTRDDGSGSRGVIWGVTIPFILVLLALGCMMAQGKDPEIQEWISLLKDTKRNGCAFCHGDRAVIKTHYIPPNTVVHCCGKCASVLEETYPAAAEFKTSISDDLPDDMLAGTFKLDDAHSVAVELLPEQTGSVATTPQAIQFTNSDKAMLANTPAKRPGPRPGINAIDEKVACTGSHKDIQGERFCLTKESGSERDNTKSQTDDARTHSRIKEAPDLNKHGIVKKANSTHDTNFDKQEPVKRAKRKKDKTDHPSQEVVTRAKSKKEITDRDEPGSAKRAKSKKEIADRDEPGSVKKTKSKNVTDPDEPGSVKKARSKKEIADCDEPGSVKRAKSKKEITDHDEREPVKRAKSKKEITDLDGPGSVKRAKSKKDITDHDKGEPVNRANSKKDRTDHEEWEPLKQAKSKKDRTGRDERELTKRAKSSIEKTDDDALQPVKRTKSHHTSIRCDESPSKMASQAHERRHRDGAAQRKNLRHHVDDELKRKKYGQRRAESAGSAGG